MSVWIITSGEYSDYCVIGYCTTEEQAIQVCASHNAKKTKWGDPYEYAEVECMDGNWVVGPVFYRYGFTFRRSGETWVLSNGANRGDDEHTVTAKTERNVVFQKRGAVDWAFVTVTVREPKAELAKKAAQDALYEKLAEVQGIV